MFEPRDATDEVTPESLTLVPYTAVELAMAKLWETRRHVAQALTFPSTFAFPDVRTMWRGIITRN